MNLPKLWSLSAGNSETDVQKDVMTKESKVADKLHKVKVLTTPAVRRIAAQFNVSKIYLVSSFTNARLLKLIFKSSTFI